MHSKTYRKKCQKTLNMECQLKDRIRRLKNNLLSPSVHTPNSGSFKEQSVNNTDIINMQVINLNDENSEVKEVKKVEEVKKVINITTNLDSFIHIFGNEYYAEEILNIDQSKLIKTMIKAIVIDYYGDSLIPFVHNIFIVKNTGSLKGVTINNNIMISIDNDDYVSTLHRRIFSIIDRCIETSTWNTFNKFGYLGKKCFAFKLGQGYISKYAMYSEEADRCETFVEIMSMHRKREEGLIYDKIVKDKITYLMLKISEINEEWNLIMNKRFEKMINFNYYNELMSGTRYYTVPSWVITTNKSMILCSKVPSIYQSNWFRQFDEFNTFQCEDGTWRYCTINMGGNDAALLFNNVYIPSVSGTSADTTTFNDRDACYINFQNNKLPPNFSSDDFYENNCRFKIDSIRLNSSLDCIYYLDRLGTIDKDKCDKCNGF